MNVEITCFMAAICRDKTEGGSGMRYFGSLGSYNCHVRGAIAVGLLDESEALTARGKAVGEACQGIPTGRAYAFSDQYMAAARAVLGADGQNGRRAI